MRLNNAQACVIQGVINFRRKTYSTRQGCHTMYDCLYETMMGGRFGLLPTALCRTADYATFQYVAAEG